MLEIKYYHKDEFGQETETRKTYNDVVIEECPAIDLMMQDFKVHLINCGYSNKIINEYAKIHFDEH